MHRTQERHTLGVQESTSILYHLESMGLMLRSFFPSDLFTASASWGIEEIISDESSYCLSVFLILPLSTRSLVSFRFAA